MPATAPSNSSAQATGAQPSGAMQQPGTQPLGSPTPAAAADTAQLPAGQGDTNKLTDVPVPPGESKGPAAAPSKQDIELRERIQSTLGTAPNLSYSARRVGVAVDKNEVTLSGDVRNERERKEVEQLVQQIQGVRKVKNQLSSR